MARSKVILFSILIVKVLRILLILGASLAILFIIIHLFTSRPFNVTFPLSFEVYNAHEQSESNFAAGRIQAGPLILKSGYLHSGNVIIENATGHVKIENVSNGFLFMFFIIILLFIVPAYYILINLRRFLQTISDGNPFIMENVQRLRILAITVIALALFAGVAKFAGGFYVFSNVNLPGNLSIIHNLDFNWEIIFLGIILFVIAEAFKIGNYVKTENDLTV